MNTNDFIFMEDRLEVTLPIAFRRFMETHPNGPTQEISNELAVLPCNAELFVIYQLRKWSATDFYDLQPELRSRRFLDIGSDGCGNYFFMPGDHAESDEIWIWEHDPHHGLRRLENETLTDYFLGNVKWKVATKPNLFETTTGVFILRADHPVRSILAPIPLDVWLDYVGQHDLLCIDENHIGENPFTKEKIVFRRWPGRAKIRSGNQDCYISYQYGALSLGTEFPTEMKRIAEQIATDLSSRIWSGNYRQGIPFPADEIC